MATFVMNEMSKLYTNVDYDPVDISAYAEGNSGIPYVWSFNSGKPGPHAMVCGIMHGNEIAGAAILDRMLRDGLRPSAGSLTLCFGNPAAYELFKRDVPYLNRFIDTDINRVWGAELTDLSNQTSEVQRARELLPIVNSVDYILDIHTMQGRGKPVALMQGKQAALDLISRVRSIPLVLTGTMHEAERLRLRDYAQFGNHDNPAVAIQLEAGQHWEFSAVVKGEEIARDFLAQVGLIHDAATAPAERQTQLEVVKIILPEGGVFEYAQDFESGTLFPERGTLLGHAGPERTEVRTPVDDCYFIMPVHFRLDGGSCGRFAVEIPPDRHPVS